MEYELALCVTVILIVIKLALIIALNFIAIVLSCNVLSHNLTRFGRQAH